MAETIGKKTNAGPVNDWFALSNREAREMSSIYLAVLPKGVVSPIAKESGPAGTEKRSPVTFRSSSVSVALPER